jgi:hypothetical protein
MRDRFKMRRIDASLHEAQMVKLEAIRDLPDELLVRLDMGATNRSIRAANLRVVLVDLVTSFPDPARRLVAAILFKVVGLRDRATTLRPLLAVSVTELRPARPRWHTADHAVEYLRNWVTSFGEVAPRGWRNRLPLAPFYLAARRKEGFS